MADRTAAQERDEARAGRAAERPSDIPARGWKAVAKRVKDELKRDHVSLLAAGVAFKGLLALFPAIVAAITIWGLVASPDQITQQLSGFTNALPEEAGNLLESQMTNVAEGETGTLSLALVISVLIALWSASSGMQGLMEGTSAAYDEQDERKFPIKRGLAILFTLGAILFLLVTLGLIAVLPAVLNAVGLGPVATVLIQVGQWVLLAVVAMVGLAVLYKYAPDRDNPQFRWTSWGAVIATVLWLAGSALFTLYVNNFGSFGETYGTFAGIIVLMLWLFLTAFIVLLGAEINAETERQTLRDTTVGEEQPIGRRGANPADTLPDDDESAPASGDGGRARSSEGTRSSGTGSSEGTREGGPRGDEEGGEAVSGERQRPRTPEDADRTEPTRSGDGGRSPRPVAADGSGNGNGNGNGNGSARGRRARRRARRGR